MNHDINYLQKKIRAKVIARYLTRIGQTRCVCFSCGNASEALKKEGLTVIEVIEPKEWWAFCKIQEYYQAFDATSGHLPLPLMNDIAEQLRQLLTPPPEAGIVLPTGSGETFVTLSMAFPGAKIKPVYNVDSATKFNPEAPLNALVQALYVKTI